MVMAFPKAGPYRRLLTAALRHRFLTLALAVTFFFGSLQLVPYIPTSLFESSDTGLSTMSVELPPGSTLADTQAATEQLTEGLLADHPAVQAILTTEGGDGGEPPLPLFAPGARNERDVSQKQFEQACPRHLPLHPRCRISFRSGGLLGKAKTSPSCSRERPRRPARNRMTLARQMRDIPGMVDVLQRQPGATGDADYSRCGSSYRSGGFGTEPLPATASLATLGDIDANLAEFDLGDRQIPIRVQIDPRYRDDTGPAQTLRVPSNTGDLVPFSAVADVSLAPVQLRSTATTAPARSPSAVISRALPWGRP
jgi:multidrug efflux pump subunit AcrB